ncbi:nucleotide exchange factor SIL1 [Leptopilina boulardi]|uniref:nucleotide exchange factor SIL1 n=1 Tax=Leptopilina boulardi TaxID=63433 RepID=UPI0021F5E6B9|nr:nucleotide exchange factor SIL1 [Leptopilina boulardi]
MNFSLYLFYSFMCYLCVNVYAADKISEKNESLFVPTREWQIVKKGTPIPKGLHVRHNFETGKTEAKLIDINDKSEESMENKEENRGKSLIIHADELQKEEKEKLTNSFSKIPIEELKLKLKNIKSDEMKPIQDKIENIQKKFKSYQELKKEFEALNMNISTETELMKDFFERFLANKDFLNLKNHDKKKVKKIVDILDDLEYLIHQIDNAQVFIDMGGLTKIISPCLNSTNDEIKSEALRLLGATAQSNPKVQAKIMETDFIQKLLHLLLTTDNIEIKSRCLFAISSLIRQFPIAQKVFFDHGGLEVFAKLLDGNQLQPQIKIMNLVNDLLIERKNIIEFNDDEIRRQRIKAYSSTNFEKKLLMHDYCLELINFSTKVFRNIITGNFIDQANELIQTIVESIITLNSVCEIEFVKVRNTLLPLINSVLNIYKKRSLINENEDEKFEDDLILIFEKLNALLQSSHDEL